MRDVSKEFEGGSDRGWNDLPVLMQRRVRRDQGLVRRPRRQDRRAQDLLSLIRPQQLQRSSRPCLLCRKVRIFPTLMCGGSRCRDRKVLRVLWSGYAKTLLVGRRSVAERLDQAALWLVEELWIDVRRSRGKLKVDPSCSRDGVLLRNR